MNYDGNNYWGYENQYGNYYATPNNYYHYNYTPPPPSHEPYGYTYPSPQQHYDDYSLPSEQDPMQERILTALADLQQSSDATLKMLQSMNESLLTTETSLEQFDNMCGSKQEDIAYNDNSFTSNDLDINESNGRVNFMLDSSPPMDFDHFEPKTESFPSHSFSSDSCSIEYLPYSSPLLNVEADYSYCNICRAMGHEPRDCPGFAYYDDMSDSQTDTISADTFSEEDYPCVEHVTSEDNNFQDDSIELINSPIEPLAHLEHIDEDFHKREGEIHSYLSQEDTLLECDSDYETSIMEIEKLLDSPTVMDLDLCQANIESYSSPSFASNPLSIEPPPHIEPYVNEKNVLS